MNAQNVKQIGKARSTRSAQPSRRLRERSSNVEEASNTLLLTLTAAARALGISRGTLYKLLDGRLGYVRVGAGDRRIPYSEIETFIARNTVKADSE